MLRRKMFRWTSGSNSKPPLQPRQTPFLLRIGAVQQNVAALVVMVAGEGTSGMNGSLPTPCVSNRPTGALFPYTSSALPSEPRHRWYPDPRPACAWGGAVLPRGISSSGDGRAPGLDGRVPGLVPRSYENAYGGVHWV